jgi:hypothetical protein
LKEPKSWLTPTALAALNKFGRRPNPLTIVERKSIRLAS